MELPIQHYLAPSTCTEDDTYCLDVSKCGIPFTLKMSDLSDKLDSHVN